jgi:Tol biopolymer transport system component
VLLGHRLAGKHAAPHLDAVITRLLLATAFLLTALPARQLAGQAPGFATGPWKTVETEHFLFLYPEELTDWTLSIARRIESVRGATEAMIGFAPQDRVTVLVDDPSNISNGLMLSGPLLYLWPTPPSPRSQNGENRGWAEVLAVHEFAHAAHLTRPTRNPGERFLWSLLPVPLDPIVLRTPRWMREGYATFVEGQLTGSGRPHGVWRPALLRTWSLEGQLPTYGAVSGTGGYYGGSMAYLVGSAFLEWLVERESGNEDALPNVWRRLTARQKRSFNSAFTGVFGAPPSELYGQFNVAVTERALALRDAAVAAGGVVEGDLFQRLTWTTGDPDVSPDGEHLAVVLRARNQPSRLVVMSTTPDTLTDKQKRERAAIFEADPEDVEPIARVPRRQARLATLNPAVGRSYRAPAFMPDGEGILVVRSDVVENARSRPDLFLWRWKEGDLRRITRGESIREADPAPDGTWAAGLRCLEGRCDIVRIDLATGTVTTLAAGSPLGPYYHPRVSPNGQSVVASVQHQGQWKLVMLDGDGSNKRFLGPGDGAARFDAEFLPDGGALVLTSTRGGIHNLELLNTTTGRVRPLTRVLGAAVAPTPSPDGDVFFLTLHSRGWDLRRISPDTVGATSVVIADPQFTPTAPVSVEPGQDFSLTEIDTESDYGYGPRFRILLPMVNASPGGQSFGLALGGTDPIGKLGWQLQGIYGTKDAWRGGSLRALWRGLRPWVHLQAFVVDGPLEGDSGLGQKATNDLLHDDYIAGALSFEFRNYLLGATHRLHAGGSAGQLDSDRGRILGFAEYGVALLQMPGRWRLRQSLRLHGSLGRTGDLDWTRWRVTGSLGFRSTGPGFNVAATLAGTDAPVASVEGLAIGGTEPPLFDPVLLTQQLAMPALEAGALRGDLAWTARADLYGTTPFRLFWWTGDADGDDMDWYHVAGIEIEDHVAAIPYLRVPAIRYRLGLARTMTGTEEGKWRAWAVLRYQP